MKKSLFCIAGVFVLLIIFSCDSGGSEEDGDKSLTKEEEAAFVIGVAMAEKDEPAMPSSPQWKASYPAFDSAPYTPYTGYFGGSANYYYLTEENNLEFNSFVAKYNDALYTINGTVTFTESGEGSHDYEGSITGSLTIEGGSLSGVIALDLEFAINAGISGGSILIEGTIAGTVDGKEVSLDIDETVPLPAEV